MKPLNKIFNLSILNYGLSLLFLCFAIYIFTYFEYLFKIQLNHWPVYLGLGSTLIFTIFSNFCFGLKSYFTSIPLILIGATIAISFYFNRIFFDLSYDGQAYHGEAVLSLVEGWNPVYERLVNIHQLWLNSYPKAGWMVSATLYKLTGEYKDIKMMNLIILFSSFALSYVGLLQIKFKWYFALLLAVMAAFSPVAILQSINLNVDGLLSGMLLILFFMGVLIYKYEEKSLKFKLPLLVAFFVGIIFFVNVKTAGLIYGLIFICGLLAYLIYQKFAGLKLLTLIILISTFLGMCVFGFNPHMTNIRDFRNMVYPSLDIKAFDYTENTPSNYLTKSKYHIFVAGLFFKSDIAFARPGDDAQLKIPFTISNSEIASISDSSNLKKGGFGPYFSGFVTASTVLFLVVILYALFTFRGNEKKYDSAGNFIETDEFYHPEREHEYELIYDSIASRKRLGVKMTYTLIFTLTLVSCLLTTVSSTLRYIPQIWLLFVSMIGFCILIFPSINFKHISHKYGIVLLIIFAVLSGIYNTVWTSTVYLNAYYQKSLITNSILSNYQERFKENPDSKPLPVFFRYHTANRILFQNYGIKYQITSDKSEVFKKCKDKFDSWKFLPESELMICTDK